ncbi:MAG: DUF4282 domain-containing protein [Aminivibrio sp.]
MEAFYDLLTFRYFISHNILPIFYFLGAAGIPFLAWRIARRLQSLPGENLSGAVRQIEEAFAENMSRSRVYGLFFLMFILMEIGWRVMFEFLMAFLQMREALVVLSGI